MRFQKINRFHFPVILVIIIAVQSVFAWQNDNNLEESFSSFKSMFNKHELYELYMTHADVVLKNEIASTVQKIKLDKNTVDLVAKRLNFNSTDEFKKADSSYIIQKMIYNMQNPPENPGKMINNSYYIESYLTLSLLFAPYDRNLTIDKKKINSNSAVIDLYNADFKISAYFVLKNNKWFITSKKYII